MFEIDFIILFIQSEFDTLNSTLTQLTNQKNIAQKRLDDLDSQVQIDKFIKLANKIARHLVCMLLIKIILAVL